MMEIRWRASELLGVELERARRRAAEGVSSAGFWLIHTTDLTTQGSKS